MKKHKFMQRFTRQVLTRFHMSLILCGTFFSGVIFSKILLLAGLEHMVARFAVALLFAYLCFFLFMRLWLHYLTTPYYQRRFGVDLPNAVDILSDVSDAVSKSGEAAVKGHGGTFGGAGSSGTWVDASAGSDVSSFTAETGAAQSVDMAGSAAGDIVSGLADEGGIVLVFLGLLLLVVLGGGVYLIYEAPVILSEAAFELVLATSLIKKARKMDHPGWAGSVLRATWAAFLSTLAVAVLAGWGLMAYCPQATRISDVVRQCL